MKKTLLVDDVIVGFDGAPVSNADQLHALTAKHKVGDHVVLQVKRGSASVDVPTTMQPPPSGSTGSASIGISVVDSFVKPFTIGIDLAHVVGPSAGTGFALGIVDKLTDGNLTGGHTVAVTGTIDADGKVGAIGGVVQKMAGAAASWRDAVSRPEGQLLRGAHRDSAWADGHADQHALECRRGAQAIRRRRYEPAHLYEVVTGRSSRPAAR